MDDIYRQGGRAHGIGPVRSERQVRSLPLKKYTAGKACPRRGETIVKENYLGGSIYYCRGCQILE